MSFSALMRNILPKLWGVMVFMCLSVVPGAFGCAAGWESQLSLLQRSRCIVQIEVLEVADAPVPQLGAGPRDLLYPPQGASSRDDAEERVRALATVRVLDVIKGECTVKRFQLLGGPYYSCAPFARYWNFEKGQKLCLILEQNVPAETTTLTLTWRSRVAFGEADELRREMVTARKLWREHLERIRKADPASFAEAGALHEAGPKSWGDLVVQKFAVLAGLAALSGDPDHLPSGLLASVVDGIMKTRQRGERVLPEVLKRALEERVEEAPIEVIVFHRRMFREFAISELFLKEETVDRLLGDEAFAHAFLETDFKPGACGMGRGSTMDVTSLYFLLGLADETGDVGMWHLFGVMADTKVSPEIILPWLRRNRERTFRNWGALQLLMSLRSKEVLPVIERSFEDESNTARMDGYFRYFLSVGAEKLAMISMERSIEMNVKFAGEHTADEILEKERDWMRSNLDQFQEVIENHGEELPAFEQKLKESRQKVEAWKGVEMSRE